MNASIPVPGTPVVTTRTRSWSVTALRNLPLRRSTPPTPSPVAPWHVVHWASYSREPYAMSAGEFGALLASETEKWGKVVVSTGLKPE